MTAIKNAILLKQHNPEAEIHILHRDIMAPGKDSEALYRKAMEEGIRFIRYNLDSPPVIAGDNNVVEQLNVFHVTLGRNIDLKTDLLVLSTPLVPRDDFETLSKMLKVPLGTNKFFLEAHVKLRPVEFATEGVFIAGSAKWPANHEEAIYQAYGAAGKAAIPMHKGVIKAEAITAIVNQEDCIGCGNCIASCPYTAIEFVEVDAGKMQKAQVNDAKCKGCGTCIASCYNGAIQQRGFTDQQVLNMISTLAKAYGGA
jgi:heterodisulfide reductase subunit A